MKTASIARLPPAQQAEAAIRRSAHEVEPREAAEILARLAVERAASLVSGSKAAAIAYVAELLGEMRLPADTPERPASDRTDSLAHPDRRRRRGTDQDIAAG